MKWATTGRVCEDVYFWLRYHCLRVVAFIYPSCLPLIREAERELKQHDKHLRPQYGCIERMGEGCKWPVLIFVFPFLLTIAIVVTIDMPLLIHANAPSQQAPSTVSVQESSQREDPGTTLTGHLKITATVLASLTGLLLTVIALTIHAKTSNLAGANFLLNAVIRRRGFLPAAAFLLGTVFTVLVGVLVSGRVGLQFLNGWTVVAVLLGLACLFILLDMLRRTMQTLGASELEQLLSAELLSCVRISFRRTLRQELISTKLSERLETLGFARCMAAEKKEGLRTEYRLDKLGGVVAVDFAPLGRIQRLLGLAPLRPRRNTASVFSYGSCDDAACITLQPNGIVTNDARVILITREQMPDNRIARLVQRSFVVVKPTESDSPWRRLREVMVSAIQRDDSATIADVSKAFAHVFDDYLEAQLAVGGQGNLVLEDLIAQMDYAFKPPRPDNFCLHDLAVNAVRNRSANCLNELLDCMYKLSQRSFHKRNETYFHLWVSELYLTYQMAGLDEKSADLGIGHEIEKRVGWLGVFLEVEFRHHARLLEQIQNLSPFVVRWLSLCLHMIKASAERADASTFNAATLHVECLLDDAQVLHHPPDSELRLAYDEIHRYKSLVYLIAGAWLMHKLRGNKSKGESVAPFVEKLATSIPDFESLLHLYAMPGMADCNTELSDLLALGFSQWDCLNPHGVDGTAFAMWVRPFYQFLLLKKAATSSLGRIDLRGIRQTAGASHDDLKQFLSRVVSPAYSPPTAYQGLSWGLSTDELGQAKQHITELLNRWASGSEAQGSGEEAPGQDSE